MQFETICLCNDLTGGSRKRATILASTFAAAAFVLLVAMVSLFAGRRILRHRRGT